MTYHHDASLVHPQPAIGWSKQKKDVGMGRKQRMKSPDAPPNEGANKDDDCAIGRKQ